MLDTETSVWLWSSCVVCLGQRATDNDPNRVGHHGSNPDVVMRDSVLVAVHLQPRF